MNNSKRIILFIFLFCSCVSTYAQDILLSQSYNNTQTIAPSFAGMFNGSKVTLAYRNQWASVNRGRTYVTYTASADYFVERYNSGFGALFTGDVQGESVIRAFEGALQYNYRVQINKNLFFRPGIQVKFISKSIDPEKLIFSENIAADGTIIDNTSYEYLEIDSYKKVDVDVSGMLYNKYFWVAANIDHLVRNNVSFLGGTEKIPMRYSLAAGGNWIYKEKGNWRNPSAEMVTFGTLVQHQGKFNQLDLGVTWTKNPMQFGVWYRNFFIPTATKSSHDALIFVVGLGGEKFKISYSYDLSLSGLSDTSGGSHELTMNFYINKKERSPIYFFCH